MTDKERAKAAVEILERLTPWSQDHKKFIEATEFLRPIAAGTHGVFPLTLLKKYGYAKGDYSSTCLRCSQVKHDMDKRAVCCLDCAMIAASQEGE